MRFPAFPRPRSLSILVVALLVVASFGFGVSTGHYRHFPYTVLAGLDDFVSTTEDPVSPDILDSVFTRDVPTTVPRLLHAEVHTREDVMAQVATMKSVTPAEFLAISEAPRPLVPQIDGDLVRLPFLFGGAESSAYAYVLSGDSRCGVLVIPGSGSHQASDIRIGVGYHGTIAETLRPLCDVYVLIKPNEDVRSVHRNGKALDTGFVAAQLLDGGYSYSASYLLEAMAFLAHLRTTHEVHGVAGLSQGGMAALLAALVERPDFAVVASGFSALMENYPYPREMSQILIPGLATRYDNDVVGQKIAQGPTRYLFTFGLKEPDIYGVDGREGATCRWLASVAPAAECLAHAAGHAFPEAELAAFVASSVAGRTVK